ncbi:amidohydrolase [Occallatibacter riparius]|uniref:Amidohydrolase n=1 Tax=Occallatibacter riparius TaxID=1002689 RepID=A0A9J7BPA8_9BACT|nr:amidohydrolase [Occallatibacter riparius]UWZ82758.1 amidohydrolase [Occallatibacter riparius]
MQLRLRLLLLVLSVLLVSASAWAGEATLILVHGKVWTENPAEPTAQAVALDGNRIIAVGTDDEIRKLAGAGTRVIDLNGRLLLPGFNDAHVHLFGGGESLTTVQTRDAKSQAEFKQRIADFAKTLPAGTWIRDGVWDHQNWTPVALPNHQLIDGVTGDHPVFLWRIDGHMVLVNALALKLAGIDRNTKNPPGGEIERDRDGNPTGILKDAAAAMVVRIMPPLSAEEQDRAMEAAMREAAAHGVTSVQNMADTPEDEDQPNQFREFQKLERSGKLTLRIYEAMNIRDWKALADSGVVAPFGNASLRIGNLKSFADGALGSETAWMDEPFTNQPGYSGISSADLLDPDKYYGELRQADKAGLQIAIHAIGDRANRTILDLYERLEKENGPADRRLRIEHAQHLHPADYARFAQLGVIASMQPYHAIDDGRWAVTELGPERIKSSYAWKSLLDAGATLAFGSDWPVAPLDPVMGIYAATTRRTLDGNNPNGWVPEQRITVAQAVHAYTMGSAFAEHQEKVKGSIEPGKLADLVVLSEDIFTIPPEAIEKTKVDMTIFDGRVVYERK